MLCSYSAVTPGPH